MNGFGEPTASESVPADFEDEFDGWIAGATISKRSVAIYAKPGLFAEYEELAREREVLEEADQGDASLGDGRVTEIDARMSDLYDEWLSSKSTWIVRALLDDDYKAIKVGLTEPAPLVEPVDPGPLADKHSLADERAYKKYEDAKAAYDAAKPAADEAREEYTSELNLRIVSRAVVEIRFASGKVSPGVSVDRLKTLQSTLGRRQILALMNASQLATYQEPEIPAPFSSRTSEDDQT